MKVERLQERLRLRDVKLKSLLEISQSINENGTTAELIREFRTVLEDILEIPRAALYTHFDGVWQCSLQYGLKADMSQLRLPERLKNGSDIEVLQSNSEGNLRFFDLLIPVHHKNRPLAYLLVGDTDKEEQDVSPLIKHMRFIQTLANLITVAIENKVLAEKSLEQERIKTEIDLAAEMQNLLVGNKNRTGFAHYDVASFYRPHMKIGGDFFDFIELPNGDAFFCVADVSGKGVSAAFLMATIQAHLSTLVLHTSWELKSLVTNLNKKVVEMVRGERFVTMFLGHIDRSQMTLRYVNAGHNPPTFCSGDQWQMLEAGTVGIGMLENLPFVNLGTVELKTGDIIVCYTDGVAELENEAGEEYGHERIGAQSGKSWKAGADMASLSAAIIAELDVFRGANEYFDDTALLCCKLL